LIFSEAMKVTSLDDLSRRLPWRLESMSAQQLTNIMRVRERRAYAAGFDAGRMWRRRAPLRALDDKLGEWELTITNWVMDLRKRLASWLR
jgi:hypothetical protein